LPNGVDVRLPEGEVVEASVFEANPVQLGIVLKLPLRILPVKGAVPANRHSREDDVEGVVEPDVVYLGAGVQAEHAVPPDGQGVNEILIKHIDDQQTVPPVALTSVDEHELLEEPELADGIVGCSCRLLPFKPCYADSNIGRIYHINIISPISNSQRRLPFIVLFNHQYNLSFLLG